jgi:hypothetical protein
MLTSVSACKERFSTIQLPFGTTPGTHIKKTQPKTFSSSMLGKTSPPGTSAMTSLKMKAPQSWINTITHGYFYD